MLTTTVDPRPHPVRRADGVFVEGATCTACGFTTVSEVLRCPVCAGGIEPAVFGPGGVVTDSTRLRIGVPGHEPPYSLAYVVVDDGPRVLVHTGGGPPLAAGTRVRLAIGEMEQLQAVSVSAPHAMEQP